jgi:hypothetical protein
LLLPDDSISHDEVVDDLRLVPADPACEPGEEQLEWLDVGHHA